MVWKYYNHTSTMWPTSYVTNEACTWVVTTSMSECGSCWLAVNIQIALELWLQIGRTKWEILMEKTQNTITICIQHCLHTQANYCYTKITENKCFGLLISTISYEFYNSAMQMSRPITCISFLKRQIKCEAEALCWGISQPNININGFSEVLGETLCLGLYEEFW